MRDREWRRAQRDRKIREVYEWMRSRNWFGYNMGKSERHKKLMEAARVRHSAPRGCSCWMCGNPRKYGANTKAERKFGFYCKEEFEDAKIRVKFNTKFKGQ